MPQTIVDAHIHWWDLDNHYYPWLMDNKTIEGGKAGLETLAQTYLLENYRKHSAGYNVDAMVHIQADYDPSNPIGETHYLSELIETPDYQGIDVALVGFADLADPKVEALLAKQASYKQTRGIRQMLNYLPDEPGYCWASENYLDNSMWCKNFALLEKYQLSFDLMCFHPQMKAAATLFAKHPNIPVVLEHAGMPRLGDLELWKEGIKQLAALPHICCKIGGFGTMIEDWTQEQIEPYVAWIIECFGVQRIMFSSNFPTDSKFSSFAKAIDALDQLSLGLSATERELFFSLNARRFYRF
ncbi:amidohydrolase [Alginatibacterium sediminis]|uniref:Amidohydrolase n=1 Tax=Alginatibacterium sediminis TaxID=2164068 RepID=A0A420EGE1_9ALTE|nr:amidohydrolase family protein [Alginatibacterium sediminis]RKF19769.1 amidohydrolase [Alginatibacterium sediminis]